MNAIRSADEYFGTLTQWKEEVLLLRKVVLETGLVETIKWGGPCYTYGKDNVVGIAAFKSYAGLWFFQGSLLKDEAKFLINSQEGKTKSLLQWRFTTLEQIQNAPIAEYIFESIENFKNGLKIKAQPNTSAIIVPAELEKALTLVAGAQLSWDHLSTSCKREYAQYISEAKREETKDSRINKIIPMILAGKGLHDKYKK